MRKTAASSIAIPLFLVITAVYGCGTDCGIAPNNLWTVADGITLKLLQNSYPPNAKTMTLVLENRSDSVMFYGQGWYFERFTGGEWRRLKTTQKVFTMEGYLLSNRDRKTLPIKTGFLPFREGLYRVTGYHPLSVAPDAGNLDHGMENVDYPPFQLEFFVSKTALPEPEANPETQLGVWQLPEIESWQWHAPQVYVAMYENAGMCAPAFVPGQNGLVAVLYRIASEDEYDYINDLLLLMDIFDRKTGIRYEVFDEPTVSIDAVTPYLDGFLIVSDKLLYCYVDGTGNMSLEPAAP
ncbi:MAG: hypothetical protein FWG10_12785 [Eubacteriaceae bacterium]|nr:hypothetical protein [Eubacteriaceae bacterium]